MSRLERVLAAIDVANAADPTQENGAPAALLYGRRMSRVLDDYAPEASEPLRLAVRGQHVERWRKPRTSYPEGRAGYLAWRRDLGRFHAQRVAELMAAAGYPPDECERAAAITRKEGLGRDPESQVLEDVACLTFMRWYLADFAEDKAPEDLRRIVLKTLRKMSDAGRAAAATLALPEAVTAALAAE